MRMHACGQLREGLSLFLTYLTPAVKVSFEKRCSYQKGRGCYPLRYMTMCLLSRFAPECIALSAKFTFRSDVWSFGIMMWEMFTLWHPEINKHNIQPYSDVDNKDVCTIFKCSFYISSHYIYAPQQTHLLLISPPRRLLSIKTCTGLKASRLPMHDRRSGTEGPT